VVVTFWTLTIASVALVASFALTLAIKRAASALGLIDVPNERSSHAYPTPTGGGLAIVLAATAAMGLLTAVGILPIRLFLAVGPGSAAVAAVGLIDDRKTLSARIRLFVHFLAAAWAVVCVGPVDLFRGAVHSSGLEWLGYGVCTVGIVWFVNMYNFMDGIDAIASSEAVFLSVGALCLGLYSAGVSYIASSAAVIGAASAGFLVWNWPPAKTFMGDVGSGYLGFVFAVLGLASGAHSGSALCSCLILAGVFVVDSTYTLLSRFLRGQRVTVPHRTHAFQLLAQKIGHRNVTLSVAVVNVTWLLPCAIASELWPQYIFWLTVLAYCPLIIGALAIGAGRPETAETSQEPSAVVLQFLPPAALKRRTSAVAPEYHIVKKKHPYSRPDIPDRSVNDVG
jgi:glycosyltransferase WbpL